MGTKVKILGIYLSLGSVMFSLTGCGSDQVARAPQTSQEWCTEYKMLISMNAQNLKELTDPNNILSLNGEHEIEVAKTFREAEMEMIRVAAKSGLLNQEMLEDRETINRDVLEPAIDKLTPVSDQLAGLNVVISQQRYLVLVNDIEKASQKLGYLGVEDFLTQFVKQVDNQCGFDINKILNSSSSN